MQCNLRLYVFGICHTDREPRDGVLDVMEVEPRNAHWLGHIARRSGYLPGTREFNRVRSDMTVTRVEWHRVPTP